MQKIIESTAIAGVFIVLALLAVIFFTGQEFDAVNALTETLGAVVVVIGWLGWMFVALVGLAFACKWLSNYIIDRAISAYGVFVVSEELKKLKEVGTSTYRKVAKAKRENPHD